MQSPGNKSGYAARYNFASKDATEEHERKPWYFGDVTREEAESLLSSQSNQDGSFLVRRSVRKGGVHVLSLKSGGKCRNYDIKTDGELVWLNSGKKSTSLTDLIEKYKTKKSHGTAEKLSRVCEIMEPPEDFELVIKGHGLASK